MTLLGETKMQITIGEKIKELRKRDGRKQEDLAKALGVTAQAVSRWESNGCYPDMGMLPTIANYFHVSIDSLFGYSNDRDSKIKECTKKFHNFFIENDAGATDLTDFIKEIRVCLNEFPGEPELRRLLAMALTFEGQKQSEKPNHDLEEAAELLEGLVDYNDTVIYSLLVIYTSMGQYDKAIERAKEQPGMQVCREILLASVEDSKTEPFAGKSRRKYQGEAILSLLHELYFVLTNAVTKNEKMYHSNEGLEILLALKKLYETIFDESNFGKFCSDMCMMELDCALISARRKDYEFAKSFFETAHEHFLAHEGILTEMRNKGNMKEVYTSPILEEVKETSIPMVIIRPEYFKRVIEDLPEEMKTEIAGDSKYKALFV